MKIAAMCIPFMPVKPIFLILHLKGDEYWNFLLSNKQKRLDLVRPFLPKYHPSIREVVWIPLDWLSEGEKSVLINNLLITMKTIQLDIGGRNLEARYTVLFRHIVEIEVISLYKGIKYQFTTDDKTANLYDPKQAEEFVREILHRLIRHIRIIQTYRHTYEALNDRYRQIADIMWDVLQRMEFNNPSDKFWYHSELQKRVLDDFNHELGTLIPDNKERYKGDFLVHPALLSQILSAI